MKMSRPPLGGRVFTLLLRGIYLAAAILKTWYFSQVSVAICYVLGVSMSTALVFVAVINIFEAALGLGLLLNVARHTMLVLALISLIGFSFVLIRLWLDPAAPSCGCFGYIRSAILGGDKSPLAIVRNALMIWAIIWLLRIEHQQPAKQVRAGSVPTTH